MEFPYLFWSSSLYYNILGELAVEDPGSDGSDVRGTLCMRISRGDGNVLDMGVILCSHNAKFHGLLSIVERSINFLAIFTSDSAKPLL